jgi:predicted ATPase
MRAALARHDALLRRAFESQGGHVFKTGGDAFCVAFLRTSDALAAALAAQLALATEPWGDLEPLRARVAIHAGAAEARDGDYFGPTLNRSARLLAIGHGGQILLSQTAFDLVRDALPSDVGLRELGSHRLKDLQRSEPVFQLVHPQLATDFPPLRSLESLPNNLPLQLTSFVGREGEIVELKRLLGTTRLVTLTGAGGSGKTRLALQLAAELLEAYPDGIWFLELATLSDPGLVPQTLAAAVGVREQPGRALVEVLAEALKPRGLLLVLDNCEHLLEACAALAERLLRSCPGVRVVATSREVLNVAGELAWPVPALSAPDPRGLSPHELGPTLIRYEAVRLFIERAVLAQPAFALTHDNAAAVARICHQLDGIPLAIELAAARVKLMAVEQIAARLDDRFRLLTGGSRSALPRHQTLRATIDWSYGLLSEPERTLLQRLSVFAGGWTLEAAEAVCAGEGVAGREVLELQGHLVDKSLVLVEGGAGGEARYRLLATIRQYAADRLVEAGVAGPTHQRHQVWCVALAEVAEPELWGPQQAQWLERLEQEHDNLRMGLEWSLAEEEGGELALRLVGALFRFWGVRGYLSEGSRWLDAALAKGARATPRSRARALRGAGLLARQQAELERARTLFDQALALYRELDDKRGLALTLLGRGRVAFAQGEYERARACYDEALGLAREIAATDIVSTSLSNLGELARVRGDYEVARALYQEALETLGERNPRQRAVTLFDLGQVSLAADDSRAARGFYRDSLATSARLGDRSMVANVLEGLAGVGVFQGHPERAAQLLGAAEALRKAINAPIQPADLPLYERTVTAGRAALGETDFVAAWNEGVEMALEDAIALALALGN